MSLVLTGSDSDVISIAAAASVNNQSVGSILMWVNLTTITPGVNNNFFGKSSAGNRFNAFYNSATGEVRFEIGGSTLSHCRVLNANLPNYDANKWVFIAFTWNVGTNAPKIFTGDLTNAIAEASAYAASAVGVYGSHDDSAGPLNIGNSGATPPGGTSSLPGSIGTVQILNRELLLGEMKSLAFPPRNVSGTVHLGHYGYTNTTTQVDWSGNGNSGAITGTTLGAHVPLGPVFGFDEDWTGLIVTAPAGRTTKNTRSNRLGVRAGLGRGIAA